VRLCTVPQTPSHAARPGVLSLCTITCEFGKLFEQWPKVGTKGWRWHQGLFLAVRLEGQLKWTVKAGSDGIEREINPDYECTYLQKREATWSAATENVFMSFRSWLPREEVLWCYGPINEAAQDDHVRGQELTRNPTTSFSSGGSTVI
jgi:hypothetical protein